MLSAFLMKTISIENGPSETFLGACPLGLAYVTVVSLCLVSNLHDPLTHIDNSHTGLPSHIHHNDRGLDFKNGYG